MEINRHNYEMFFLLYADNELDVEECKVVEAFVALHTDLKEELRSLMRTRLSAGETIPFLHKAALYKSASSVITPYNCEEYFLLYADNELNEAEQKEVEDFIAQHPQRKAELTLIQRVKLQPDIAIAFADKHSLHRTEKTTARVFSFQWRRMVAAASIVAIGSWIWMNAGNVVPRQGKERPLAVEERLTPREPTQNESKGANEATPLIEIKGSDGQLAAAEKDQPVNKNVLAPYKEQKNSNGSLNRLRVQTNNITGAEQIKESVAVEYEPASFDQAAKLVAHVPLAIKKKRMIKSTAVVSEEVKPLILDQAAFQHKDNEMMHEAITQTDEGITFLDTDNTEKRSKGMFRGLLRKASRFVDHVTNSGINDEKQSVVRVASFEITRK